MTAALPLALACIAGLGAGRWRGASGGVCGGGVGGGRRGRWIVFRRDGAWEVSNG